MRGNAPVTHIDHRITRFARSRHSSAVAIALICVWSIFFCDLERFPVVRNAHASASATTVPPRSTISESAAASAQEIAIAGAVVDELGGAIVGADVTVRDATGQVVHAVAADAAGRFSIPGLRPGKYAVLATHVLFEDAHASVEVAAGAAPSMLRLTMKVAGPSESLVVTGRRVETRLSETPQKIEIISATDIERSVASDITDVLKKNSGVDVVQYNGVLSGVGIRGFRPETSGVNKRSLLLIDGRPSGVTNLATLLLDNVDHIEVMKGPASSIYGASAMGGVINVITKHSHGPVQGGGRAAYGSFAASELAGRAGGNLTPRVDFDVTGNLFNQGDDYRMGNGVVRPATTYKTYDGSVRLGADLSNAWRVDGRVNGYLGRDIDNPGDVFTGTSSQGRKNLERSTEDVRLSGQLGSHVLSSTYFMAEEQGHTSNVRTTNPLDQPFLPYLSFESQVNWKGLQLRDSWGWQKSNNLVAGLDVEIVNSISRSYTRTGDRQGPFSADNNKNTVGVYAENTLRANQGGTVISLGGRVDRITVETVDTPFKTGFTPSTTAFTVFNPSIGLKQRLVSDLRLHASAGRAFVPPDAGALTGFTATVVSGRTQINQGNPDLKPEHSVSVDAGLEWLARSTHLDVTYFQTTVSDRVVSNVLISSPPPPAPIVLSAVNTLSSHIGGMDVDFNQRVNPRFSLFSNITHYFSRREDLPTTGERNILNVAANTVRLGVDLDLGRLSSRLAARYVQGRQDQDFNVAGSPVVDYPDFAVVDASATYRLHHQHSVLFTVNNLFDTYYYEKKGYPLAGISYAVKYRFGL
jgi:outer membrane cobalamin receptor